MEVVHVPVNEVEASGLRRDRLELDDLVRDRIDDGFIGPQAAGRAGDELGARLRVATGKEGHVVALPHELLGQVMDDPLGPAVSRGRDALRERCNLRDSHPEGPSFS